MGAVQGLAPKGIGCDGLVSERRFLEPAESMALTVALAQIERGDEVPPNTTAVLVWALDRITSVAW